VYIQHLRRRHIGFFPSPNVQPADGSADPNPADGSADQNQPVGSANQNQPRGTADQGPAEGAADERPDCKEWAWFHGGVWHLSSWQVLVESLVL
jgi:hypothetical protein